MFPEEAIEDALVRVTKLEEILDEFFNRIAQASSAAEVNVAAGVAYQKLHGGE